MRRLRVGYRDVVGAHDLPDDPWVQLRDAIEAVFRSWQSDRAVSYRRREGIAEDLGTAVTIQAMVFGNRGADSGTGVVFTRDPSTGEPVLYGDVMFDAQGEDVVAGTHAPEPIAVAGRAASGRRRRIAPLRGSPRAALRRHVRHRVHHRERPPLDPPGAGRQAESASGAADGHRHGRGRGVPPVAGGRRAPCRSPSRRATAPVRPGGDRRAGHRDGPAGIARRGHRHRRDLVVCGRGGRRCWHVGHPRPVGDVAGRRPWHGQGGWRAYGTRRPRQPRRRRGTRLGHPGRGRRRVRGPGRRWRPDRWPGGWCRRADHHRRRDGRDLPRRAARKLGGRP